MSTEQRWYVSVAGGEPVGPVTLDQLVRGTQAGKIPADAMVCKEGGSAWQPITAVLPQAAGDPRTPKAMPTHPARTRLLLIAGSAGLLLLLVMGVIIVVARTQRDVVKEANAEAYIKDVLAVSGAAECSWDAHVYSDGSGSGKRYWLQLWTYSDKRYEACSLAMANVAIMPVDCRDGLQCREPVFLPVAGSTERFGELKFPCGRLEFQSVKSVRTAGNELTIEYTARQVPDKAVLDKLTDCTLSSTPDGSATLTASVTKDKNETWDHALCRARAQTEWEVEHRKLDAMLSLNAFSPKCASLGCSFRCGSIIKSDRDSPVCGAAPQRLAVVRCLGKGDYDTCMRDPARLEEFRIRLKKRYDLARDEDVSAECKKAGDACGGYETLEVAYQAAHASALSQLKGKREAELNAARVRKWQECDAKNR